MSNIIYPTLDLFVYHLREGLGDGETQVQENHKAFWANLPNQLQGEFIKTALEAELAQHNTRYVRLLSVLATYCQKDEARYQKFQEFADSKTTAKLNRFNFIFEKALNNYTVKGYYYPVRLNNTYGLLLNCCVDDLENYHPVSWFKNLRDLGDFKVNDLPEFKSQKGNLGKTWIVSGFLPAKAEARAVAEEAYIALMDEQWQHPQEGKFLGATVFEAWKSPPSWKDKNSLDKNIHVLIVLYPDRPTREQREETLNKARKFYRDWIKLFCYRNRILFAYGESRRLKGELQAEFEKIMAVSHHITQLEMAELQAGLGNNLKTISKYAVNLSYLEIQREAISNNLKSYQNQLKYIAVKLGKMRATEFKLSKEFSDIVNQQYLGEIKRDHASLTPALKVLENAIATTRGLVEAKQAERDRHFSTSIQVLGVGIAAGAIFATSYTLVKPEAPAYLPFSDRPLKWPSPSPHPFVFSLVFSILFSVGAGWVAWWILHSRNKA